MWLWSLQTSQVKSKQSAIFNWRMVRPSQQLAASLGDAKGHRDNDKTFISARFEDGQVTRKKVPT